MSAYYSRIGSEILYAYLKNGWAQFRLMEIINSPGILNTNEFYAQDLWRTVCLNSYDLSIL